MLREKIPSRIQSGCLRLVTSRQDLRQSHHLQRHQLRTLLDACTRAEPPAILVGAGGEQVRQPFPVIGL